VAIDKALLLVHYQYLKLVNEQPPLVNRLKTTEETLLAIKFVSSAVFLKRLKFEYTGQNRLR